MPVGFCSIPSENVKTENSCVAFRGQGDAAVRQIASMNDSYGYTIVNCVWPDYSYSSISQLSKCIMLIISILTCRSEVLCRVCILQIQPRQHALEHAACVAPIPQRELDHTDQGYICPERATSCSGNRCPERASSCSANR